MKNLAVFFILVVCVQNVVPDEVLDFKELFRNGKKRNQTQCSVMGCILLLLKSS